MRFKAVAIGLWSARVTAGYKHLEEMYGALPPNLEMASWKVRTQIAREPEFYRVRQRDICRFPLEIVIVQDATASFQDDFIQMKDVQLPTMIAELAVPFPGSTIGVVSHRDKPLLPYGNEVDYCQKFEAPLTNDLGVLQGVYNSMISTGGADPPENAFGAMVAALQSPTTGWSNPLATRVVVVATDAHPHFSNDSDNLYGLPPFNGIFDEANAASQCLSQYYPAPEQVRAAVGAREVYVVPLVFDGGEQGALVLRSWQWLNSFLGQTPEFINTMANDASDFWLKLQIALAKISEYECGPIDNTTPPPPPPPTTAPPAPLPPTTAPPAPLPPTTAPPAPLPPTTAPPAPIPPTAAPPAPLPPICPVPPCPLPPCVCPPCITDPCDPCDCAEGVLIKLRYRPQKLSLIVENPDPITE